MSYEELQAENKRLREALEKIKVIAVNPDVYVAMLGNRISNSIDVYAFALSSIVVTASNVLEEK